MVRHAAQPLFDLPWFLGGVWEAADGDDRIWSALGLSDDDYERYRSFLDPEDRRLFEDGSELYEWVEFENAGVTLTVGLLPGETSYRLGGADGDHLLAVLGALPAWPGLRLAELQSLVRIGEPWLCLALAPLVGLGDDREAGGLQRLLSRSLKRSAGPASDLVAASLVGALATRFVSWRPNDFGWSCDQPDSRRGLEPIESAVRTLTAS